MNGGREIYINRNFVQKPEGNSHLEELAIDGKIILK
jgi:hypothetical protein